MTYYLIEDPIEKLYLRWDPDLFTYVAQTEITGATLFREGRVQQILEVLENTNWCLRKIFGSPLNSEGVDQNVVT